MKIEFHHWNCGRNFFATASSSDLVRVERRATGTVGIGNPKQTWRHSLIYSSMLNEVERFHTMKFIIVCFWHIRTSDWRSPRSHNARFARREQGHQRWKRQKRMQNYGNHMKSMAEDGIFFLCVRPHALNVRWHALLERSVGTDMNRAANAVLNSSHHEYLGDGE